MSYTVWKKTFVFILVTLASSLAIAQVNTPGSTPGGTSTWSGLMPQTRMPQAGLDGSLKGSNLTERMDSIRRRPIDSSIARPFGTDAVEAGGVPRVARRALTAFPETVGPALNAGPDASAGTPDASALPQLPPPVTIPTEPIPALPAPVEEPAPVQVPAPAPIQVQVPIQDPVPVAATPVKTVQTIPVTPIDILPMDQTGIQPVQAQQVVEPKPNVLLSNAGPALSFETSGPRRITIGKQATYQVKMINQGKSDAQHVICSVQLPSWIEVGTESATTGSHRVEPRDSDGNIVRWRIDKIEAGQSETLSLNLIPRDSRPFDLAVGWAFAPDRKLAQIEVQEPKLELALAGPEQVLFGETEVLTVTISNPGTGNVDNVILNLVPLSSKQQITGSREIGTIKAGERKTIELELTAHQAGRLLVKAMAFASDGLRSESSHEVFVRRANLDIAVLGPPQHYAATAATYKVRIENTGDAVAEQSEARASLPAGAKYLSSTDGGKFDNKRGQIHWPVGSLRPGAVRVFEFQCELNSAGDNRVDIQCTAATDLSVAKSVTTRVEALADLKLYVNDPPGAIAVGRNAEYEVRIVNRGTKNAEDVQVVGYFSEGIEPESIQGGKGDVMTGQVVLAPIKAIQPGQELVFKISARATVPGDHVFRAELQCTNPQTKLATEEWTKFYGSKMPEERIARPEQLGRPLR